MSQQFEFPPTNAQEIRTPGNLHMKQCQILQQNIGLNTDMFLRALKKRGRNLLLASA